MPRNHSHMSDPHGDDNGDNPYEESSSRNGDWSLDSQSDLEPPYGLKGLGGYDVGFSRRKEPRLISTEKMSDLGLRLGGNNRAVTLIMSTFMIGMLLTVLVGCILGGRHLEITYTLASTTLVAVMVIYCLYFKLRYILVMFGFLIGLSLFVVLVMFAHTLI